MTASTVGGFLGLAVCDSLAGVLVATVLVGFAAALFSPAVESAVAIEAGKSERLGGPGRVETFALLSVCNQIGSFTGPLVGSVLLLVDFRVACLVAAVIFVVIIAAHLKWLPNEPGEHHDDPWHAGWTDVVHNKLFLLFAIAMSAQLVAYNQLYLLLPLEIERAWGSQRVLGWFFALSAVFVVTSQLPITRKVRNRSPLLVLPIGFAVMAVAFLVVAAASPFRLSGAVGLIPAAGFVLLLAFGQMIAMPRHATWCPAWPPSGDWVPTTVSWRHSAASVYSSGRWLSARRSTLLPIPVGVRRFPGWRRLHSPLRACWACGSCWPNCIDIDVLVSLRRIGRRNNRDRWAVFPPSLGWSI